MNTIVIKGRLTAGPEMRKTTNGVPVANFTVAVDRTFNRDETDFSAARHGAQPPNS